ncbi:MAG: succinyl-CoA:acetate CoA-transferase, partial [Clostridiales bacterium]|nr:succinyl-CoA:acetate CoA-transferase [Clostridiales bacterium]
MEKERLRCNALEAKIATAEEAALFIKDGDTVATSGFTPSGYPKAVPLALAERVKNGEKIGITLITGASVGSELDGILAETGIVKRRFPYQTNNSMRNAINKGTVQYA